MKLQDDLAKEPVVPWVDLVAAGVLEVVWAYAMKLSNGFSRPIPTIVMVITMI
ncbi:MAG: DMT family transporter, partial [Beijerinckiaceae bacterium]